MEVDILQVFSVMVTLVLPLYVLSFTILYRQGKLTALCTRVEKIEIHCDDKTCEFDKRIKHLEDKSIYAQGVHNGSGKKH